MNGPMKAQPVQERRGLDRRGDGLAATGAGAADVVISIILARVRRMGGCLRKHPPAGHEEVRYVYVNIMIRDVYTAPWDQVKGARSRRWTKGRPPNRRRTV
ncbi:hypothetical protein GCM10023224_37170 [Streptomonospora halophila]|uniref:Uncharacterized protein n=1 Tax=Streptomonospora halophila TaxID=427369 RepID=A0ABP9GPN2_9ACTN